MWVVCEIEIEVRGRKMLLLHKNEIFLFKFRKQSKIRQMIVLYLKHSRNEFDDKKSLTRRFELGCISELCLN